MLSPSEHGAMTLVDGWKSKDSPPGLPSHAPTHPPLQLVLCCAVLNGMLQLILHCTWRYASLTLQCSPDLLQVITFTALEGGQLTCEEFGSNPGHRTVSDRIVQAKYFTSKLLRMIQSPPIQLAWASVG